MSEVVKLEDLCLPEHIGKYGIPAVAEDFNEAKVRYLRITDIDDFGNLLEDDKKSVSSPEIEKYILKEGDIVFARTGNSTGRTYYHEEKNGKLAFAGFLIKFSLDKSKVNPKYLKYFTISKPYKQWVDNLSNGSTRGNINAKTFAECPIILPSREQQDYLVRVLSSLEEKIQTNNQINQELEAMAKTLYDYWFVQFDFPDQNGKPYKSSGGKMVYNPELKREIPEGWGVGNFFDVVEVQYGYPFSTEFFNSTGEGVPVIRIRDILGNDITNYSTEEVEDKYKINVGDVLIGMDGNFHINYWIQENCYLNQRVVKVNSDNLPNMVLKYQIEPFIKLREKSVSRTTVGHLSDKDLKSINVILPKDKNLSTIFERFESILENIIINQQQNQELTQLRDWLLPMLMNGQVKVE